MIKKLIIAVIAVNIASALYAQCKPGTSIYLKRDRKKYKEYKTLQDLQETGHDIARKKTKGMVLPQNYDDYHCVKINDDILHCTCHYGSSESDTDSEHESDFKLDDY